MTDGDTRIGIEVLGASLYGARVEYGTGRPEVTVLTTIETGEAAEHQLLQGGRVAVSVADDRVIVKPLSLSANSGDIMTRARFEMSQSALEDENRFLFDIIPTAIENRFVGLMLRRELLDREPGWLRGEEHMPALAAPRYRMRAAALAEGYLGFCRQTGGDFVCLADFTGRSVSMALIYRGKTVDLIGIPVGGGELSSTEDCRTVAAELKTLLSYKKASLFQSGITTPMSRMVALGENFGQSLKTALENQFSIEVTTPAVNTGFFKAGVDPGDVPAERYLVALGLTAN
ncbi:MAG: hypothetical protein JSW34_00270 [Candidatus Zixiibacteriota bacterium]|nr:MAG: hypothetical protein JSW34_00270 [candidate division Zixibacteria bacterium]